MKLKTKEIQFMIEVLDLPKWLRNRLEYLMIQNEELTNEEADALRDLCGDRLQIHGFDKNYETTSEGNQLEDLIDKLFVD
ncbi:MAG: hypothetical protein KKB51_06220 [Candidatus Riflebacteria bacterium]|nr:hypothetical protein [Candidatus Riflebacteria bacterium]